METNSFCQRVIEAANARPGKVAMLIGPGGAEMTTFGEMLSQIRSNETIPLVINHQVGDIQRVHSSLTQDDRGACQIIQPQQSTGFQNIFLAVAAEA